MCVSRGPFVLSPTNRYHLDALLPWTDTHQYDLKRLEHLWRKINVSYVGQKNADRKKKNAQLVMHVTSMAHRINVADSERWKISSTQGGKEKVLTSSKMFEGTSKRKIPTFPCTLCVDRPALKSPLQTLPHLHFALRPHHRFADLFCSVP